MHFTLKLSGIYLIMKLRISLKKSSAIWQISKYCKSTRKTKKKKIKSTTEKAIFSLKFVELQNFPRFCLNFNSRKNKSFELKIEFSLNVITPYVFGLDLIKPVHWNVSCRMNARHAYLYYTDIRAYRYLDLIGCHHYLREISSALQLKVVRV